jgi:hypothetical protein
LAVSRLAGLSNHGPSNRGIPDNAQFLVELEAVEPYALIRLVHHIVGPGRREAGQKEPPKYQPEGVHCFL